MLINLCAITWVHNLFTVWWSSFPLFWLALPFTFPYKQSWLSPFSSFSSSFVIQLLLHLGNELVVCFILSCLLWIIWMCCEEVISTTLCGTMMSKKGFVHVSFSWVQFLVQCLRGCWKLEGLRMNGGGYSLRTIKVTSSFWEAFEYLEHYDSQIIFWYNLYWNTSRFYLHH